ncbi:helix-turn-helix domain-containing protein [Thermovibrio sp.]
MKRIYNIGVIPEDKRARLLLERVGKVEKIHLSITPFHLSRFESHSPKPDFLLISINSMEEIRRKTELSAPVPVILTGEYYPNFSERGISLPPNVYFSNYNPLTLFSILKALFKTAKNVKIELKNGSIINLITSLSYSKLEKIIPTGRGKERELSYKEGIILKELFQSPGEVVPYKRFSLLGIKKDNIPVYMSRLRKVVSEIEPILKIKSVRNKGYFLSYGL